jgi:dTDP-4-dehydrorhamnose 3,5-epimerase
MKFIPTDVDGCFVVELEALTDERGYFARAWCADEMADAGVATEIAQINMSSSSRAATIRGLHWRPLSHPEAKFVRCIAGRVFDVCVDIRHGSPTFLHWVGVELTPDNRKALAVPAGCAHGYQTLEPDSEVIYAVSAPFEPGVETGARWDEPSFGIDWPIREAVTLSEKDRAWPDFELRDKGSGG